MKPVEVRVHNANLIGRRFAKILFVQIAAAVLGR